MKLIAPFVNLFRPTGGLLSSILRLAFLNVLISSFAAFSFLGGIQLVAWINRLRREDDPAAQELPFPYPGLFLLYVVLFVAAWLWFAKRLSTMELRQRLAVAVGGALPLLVFGLLGYAVLALLFAVSGGVGEDRMPAATFYVLSLIATLVMGAALSGVLVVLLVAPRPTVRPQPNSL